MSVVMEKCVAAYHDDATVSTSARPMTGHAWCTQKSIARTTRAVIVFMGLSGMRWSADGMVGGSNRPLRRQEKGKMEALGSSSFVGAVHGRQSRHPCDIRRPVATLDGLKCRKSEIGDIFLFAAGKAVIPPYVYVPGGCRRRALDKGCISPHWCPKLRSSLTGCIGPATWSASWATGPGLIVTEFLPKYPGIDDEDWTTKTVAGHHCGAWPRTDYRKPASGREVFGR